MYALLQRLKRSAMALTSARLLLVILALWVPAVNASVRVSADPASPSAQDRPSPDYDQPANHPAKDDDDGADWLSQDEKAEWIDGLMHFSYGLQEGGERDPRSKILPPVYGHPLSQSSSRVNGGDILDYGGKEDESRQEKKPHRETPDSVNEMFAKRPPSRKRSVGNLEQHGYRHRQAAAEENPLPEMGQRFLSPNDQDIQEAENGGRYIDGRRNRLRIRQGEASLPTAPAVLQDPYDTSDMLEAEGGDRARNEGRNRLHSHYLEAPLATAAPPQKPRNSDGLNDNSGILEGGRGCRSRFHNHHDGPLLATAPTALQDLGYSERVHLEDREKRAWSPVTNNVSCWPRLINYLYGQNPVNTNCLCTTTTNALNITCNMRNARRVPIELFRWSRANGGFPRDVQLTYHGCPASLTSCQSVTYCWCTSMRLYQGLRREIRNRRTCKNRCARIGVFSRTGSCPCRRGK